MANGFMKRVRLVALAIGGVGLICGSTANAGDKLFSDVGDKLNEQLSALTKDDCTSKAACGTSCGTSCGDSECCLGEPYRLFDEDVTIGGWMQFGYHSDATIGGPRSNDVNTHPDDLNLHQLWLYAEDAADGSCGLDIGWRVDVLYGVDAQNTQSYGNDPGNYDFRNGLDHGIYGWAVPQAYVDVASGDWSVKLGHFFSPVGYEKIAAPSNFFYSHSFAMRRAEPWTHTGVLMTYAAADDLDVYAGWSAGWDTGFDRVNNGSTFIGGASLDISDDTNVSYIMTLGNFGVREEGYSHSLVMQTKLTCNLDYIVQSDLVETNAGQDHQFGINQYLIYRVDECLGLGARLEWFKADSLSINEMTFGANIRHDANVMFRPEIRHEWSEALDYEETIFGVDAIITF
jgi:hypothetical protein